MNYFFLIGLIYIFLFFVHAETNAGLNIYFPIVGSVLEIPAYCFSPFEVVRRFNFSALFLSPLFAPNLPLLLIHLVELEIIGLLLHGCNSWKPLNLFKFVIVSYILRIIISIVSFYTLHYTLHFLFISHLSHDCTSGLSALLIPLYVWVAGHVQSNSRGRWGRKLAITTLILFINIIEIIVYVPNTLTNLLSFLTSNLLFPFYSQEHNEKCGIIKSINYIPDKSVKCSKTKCLPNPWSWIVFFLLLASYSYHFEGKAVLRKPGNGTSIAITISTSPRPGSPTYLLNTIDSFLEVYTNPKGSTRTNFTLYVISYATNEDTDIVFNAAKYLYNPFANPGISIHFVSGSQALALLNHTSQSIQNKDVKQRLNLDFAASLMYAYSENPEAEFIMLHEDDFPICPGTWSWNEDAISLSSKHNSCGVFLGTGGAGLVIKRKVVPQVISLLLDNSLEAPADVKVQNCIRGMYTKHCSLCHNTSLLVASHLVFGHIGFISSMNHAYSKTNSKWSCGWRHAFNGDPDVTVLHTDENIY